MSVSFGWHSKRYQTFGASMWPWHLTRSLRRLGFFFKTTLADHFEKKNIYIIFYREITWNVQITQAMRCPSPVVKFATIFTGWIVGHQQKQLEQSKNWRENGSRVFPSESMNLCLSDSFSCFFSPCAGVPAKIFRKKMLQKNTKLKLKKPTNCRFNKKICAI